MIGSDIAEGLREKRYSQLVQKYLAPVAAVTAAYHIMGDYKDDPRAQLVLLKDAYKLAPAFAPLDVRPPPVLTGMKSGGEALLSVFSGDLERMQQSATTGAKKVGETFLPFAWVPKMFKDIETIATGQEPQE
jgi:hypothetical protein